MTKDDLEAFLSTGILGTEIVNTLKDEVLEYRKAVLEGKGVKPVFGDQELIEFLTAERFISLLKSYLAGMIKEWELEYFLVLIELCYEDVDERCEEIIFSLSDPYLGYPINEKNVKTAISFLEGLEDQVQFSMIDDKLERINYSCIFLESQKG